MSIGGQTVTESIAPIAFRSSLLSRTPVLLHEHQASKLLARKSVNVTQSNDALDVDAEFVDTENAREVAALIRAEEITSMSFGFQPTPNGFKWERRSTGPHRTLQEGELFELSTVVMPVYSNTSATLRSWDTIPDGLESQKAGRDAVRWQRLLSTIVKG
jgi:HK97 family phage prohead protease